MKKKKYIKVYKIDDRIYISDFNYVYRNIIIDGKKTNYIIDRMGNVYNKKRKKKKKPVLSSGDYYRVQLRIDGVPRSFSIHRLVANAFIPNPENKPEVNHKDGNKSHNYIENLEWVTKSENVKHAFVNNLNSNKGSMNPKSKLNEKQVEEIWKLFITEPNLTFIQLANMFNVSKSTISHIYNGDTWKEYYHKYSKFIKTKKYKYDDYVIKDAKKLISENKKSMKEISKITGVNINYLYSLKLNKYRKEV